MSGFCRFLFYSLDGPQNGPSGRLGPPGVVRSENFKRGCIVTRGVVVDQSGLVFNEIWWKVEPAAVDPG